MTTRRQFLQGAACAALMAAARESFGQKPAPIGLRAKLEGKECTSPQEAVRLAADDAENLDHPEVARYVWVPDWIPPQSGYSQVSFVANSTITRTSNIIRPESVAAGRLVRIDLDRFAGSEAALLEILRLYESMSARDSWFSERLKGIVTPTPRKPLGLDTLRDGDPCEIQTGGSWGAGTFVRTDGDKFLVRHGNTTWRMSREFIRPKEKAAPTEAGRSHQSIPARYLGTDGERLSRLTNSSVPIMRLDEWVAFTFSTINGGLYYELAGVEKDLSKTVARFAGADAAEKVLRANEAFRKAERMHRESGGERSIYDIAGELDAELSKSKALITESGVTGRQRLCLFVAGTATSPADGLQLVAVTYDIAEDNTDPNADPQRNLTTYEKYNGGEAILAMQNGMLLYVVFDAQDRVIASVPDNVAHDFRARQVRSNASTTRVFSGLSCANCHDFVEKNWGWQPVVNDMAYDLQSVTRFLGDRDDARKSDKLKELQRLAANYKADDNQLAEMLDRARLPYQKAVFLATNERSSRAVVQRLADSHWGYWYDAVSPVQAAIDLGYVLQKDDAQAMLLRDIEPEQDILIEDLVKEDIVLARLKAGKSVTPAQWRAIFTTVALRMLVKE